MSRQTVAVLMDAMDLFDGGGESQLRQSIDAAGRRFDLNLLMAFGLPLDSPHPWGAAHNAVFELMAADCVDALIIVSTSLATYGGEQSVRRLADRYGSRPLCSIGLAVPGIPSVLLDYRSGVQELVDHLVRVHGCCRIGFVGGPIDGANSYIGLEDFDHALGQHGLTYDPRLVANADAVRHSGQGALDEILDRGACPDAVVVANDGMALGVIAALRGRGFRVPNDVRVTSFGNLSVGRLANPPLSTVAQPLPAMAEQAVSLVVDQLAGRSVPDCTHVPAQFVARESCGCNWRPHATGGADALRPAADFLRRRSAQLLPVIADCMGRGGAASGAAARLLEALQAELDGQVDAFPTVLEALLTELGDHHERYHDFQIALTRLRERLLEVASTELENLWHEARTLVSLVCARHCAHQRSRLEEITRQWADTQDLLASAVEPSQLGHLLGEGLPTLGVRTALVSQYSAERTSELEPLLSLEEGRARAVQSSRYPTRELFPPSGYAAGRRHTSLVFPLAFEAQPMGVAVFEQRSETVGYEVIRSQISAALRSVTLHQEVVRQSLEHQLSEQERQATAERLQSLSMLAGGVAHDLNNVLGPMVALPDVIQSELSALDDGKQSPFLTLYSDLDEIRHAAQCAARTVGDLLTLGRQGSVSKELLDLNQLIETNSSILSDGPLRSTSGGIHVVYDLDARPLLVCGSEVHLLRALVNLVRNAIESIEGGGRVVIKTRRCRVGEPVTGYETLPPGDYAAVKVSDTGAGIQEEDRRRLFEPFFARKKATRSSGSGLGLAIVHAVTKEHAGFVDVESRAGMGSTFALYIPRATGEAARSAPPSQLPPRTLRILVVDDEPAQRRTARRVLSHQGYHVDTASNGRETLERFVEAQASRGDQRGEGSASTSPYDAVVLDMNLNEDEDGLELFERIRRIYPGQKGVLVSGYAKPERAELSIERGLLWLAKPYTADALAQVVCEAVAVGDEPTPAREGRSAPPSP